MSSLTGTGALARLALRRDRIRLPAWTLIAVGLVASTASSIKDLYPDAAHRQTYAESVGGNPASAVLGGPGYGLPELGGITVAEMASTTLTLVALVSAMLVIRHTRKEEETGRAELLRSGVVGRHAPLAAALIVAIGLNLVIAAGTIASLIGYGLPTPGSVAFGLALAGTGIVFATVAAVATQLTEHSRTANGDRVRRIRRQLHPACRGRREFRRPQRLLVAPPVLVLADGVGVAGAALRR
jgi:ABC-2 type transport system permease protein